MTDLNHKPNWITFYDPFLLTALGILIPFGLLMLASSSIAISQRHYGTAFHYLFHQLIYLSISLGLAGALALVKIKQWYKISRRILICVLIILILILIPGLGRHVNGSTRWLHLGFLNIQIAEFAKLAVILYLASYLTDKIPRGSIQQSSIKFIIFLKPLFVVGSVAVLLLCEPDFGTTTVILATSLITLFLVGIRLGQFILLMSGIMLALIGLAITAPYRWIRLTSFLNPWANQFDAGYQLTQSLIAFGRGGWFGLGLGESIQKLFYLPEAHTDFLFAVLTEELGLVGAIVLLLLFAIIVWRALMIGRRCALTQQMFPAYCAYGIGLSIALQTMVHVGVNAGILPTKGLTLPFMSYGGNSLLVSTIMIVLLLRIDYESQLARFGFRIR